MGSDPFRSSVEQRLAELAERDGLGAAAVERMRVLLELVAEDETAPTTVRDPAQAVDVHIADSLSGLEIEALRSAGAIADLGAGAGFPGLVLAAALPAARVALVESVGKKTAFIERAAAAMGLDNVEVVNGRAEEWQTGIGANDVVTARALAPLGVLVEYAAPLLRDGGVLVAWKGVRDAGEEAVAERAAAQIGLELAEVRPVQPWEDVEARHLYVYSKVRDTPPRFPRRAGMARKRPLGTST
jgi:16S rRNA (guanine527-N7)-methyltransferase